MKKVIFSSIVFIMVAIIGYESLGQGETNRWYFGRRAGFDFSTTPPTMLSDSPYPGAGDVEEAHATISDAAGNFLFYTNGQTVWNRNGIAMPNGAGLNGHWSTTQCATVFPVPGSTTDYYILTTPLTGSANELQWNRVDMSLAAGLGDIKTPVASNKNQAMPSCPTYMMESVVSVPHFNGTDIWVIAHTADNPSTSPANEGGSFVVWLVTSAGIAYSNTYTLGYAYPADPAGPTSRGIGIMKSNSCFNRIFISYYNASSRVEGFSFSNSTGVVSNWPAPISGPLVIDQYRNTSNTLGPIGSFSYGLEISGNGRYLYNTRSGETGDRTLNQYDLQAGTGSNADINNSAVRLSPAAPDGVRYGQLQMGPDGKIYHTLHNWNNVGAGGYCKISVVNAPNTAGAGANFVEVAYNWATNGVGSTMGLPSFHKGFVAGRPNITSSVSNLQEICLGDAVDFNAVTAGTPVTSYQWNIDKNLNAVVDYSGAALSSISHTYGTAGNYIVELRVTDICGYTYTSESPVTVLPRPTAAGTVSCSPIRGNVTAPNGAYTYAWFSDAAGNNPIANGTTNVSLPVGSSGNVYLKVVTSASSSSATNVLRNTGTMNTWGGAGGTIVNFTVTNAITLNSFEWGNGTIPGWPYPPTTYTVTIQNAAGTINYFTNSHTTPDGSSAYNKFTETGLGLFLTPGTYRFQFSSQAQVWNASTNASDANASITSNPASIGNFNYSVIDNSVVPMACAQMATIPYNCPLPVTWLGFNAQRESSQSVLLTWVTGTETESDKFIILRSTDGINFSAIGTVKASGNSDKAINYSYTDTNVPSGIMYYKLQQIDFNGQYMFSEIRTVSGQTNEFLSLYPNPGTGNFKIAGANPTDLLSIEVYTTTGQLISQKQVTSNEEIIISALTRGFYIVKITTSTTTQTIRYNHQ